MVLRWRLDGLMLALMWAGLARQSESLINDKLTLLYLTDILRLSLKNDQL